LRFPSRDRQNGRKKQMAADENKMLIGVYLRSLIKVSSDSRPKKLDGGRGAGGRECDETGQ
jgi:hypothetical protein